MLGRSIRGVTRAPPEANCNFPTIETARDWHWRQRPRKPHCHHPYARTGAPNRMWLSRIAHNCLAIRFRGSPIALKTNRRFHIPQGVGRAGSFIRRAGTWNGPITRIAPQWAFRQQMVLDVTFKAAMTTPGAPIDSIRRLTNTSNLPRRIAPIDSIRSRRDAK